MTHSQNTFNAEEVIEKTIRYCGLPVESLSDEVARAIRQYIDDIAASNQTASLEEMRAILRANYPRNNAFFGSQLAYLNKA